jgi:hypothetical protein
MFLSVIVLGGRYVYFDKHMFSNIAIYDYDKYWLYTLDIKVETR